MNKYDFFNRCILAQSYVWIQNHIDERSGGDIPDICYRIKTAGFNSLHINRFSHEEAKILETITKSEEFAHIKETNISLIVMPLEVMRLYVERIPRDKRPIINISDKKLLRGKNEYFPYMIAIRKANPEMYKKQKDIIETTVANASAWYDHMSKHLIKGD